MLALSNIDPFSSREARVYGRGGGVDSGGGTHTIVRRYQEDVEVAAMVALRIAHDAHDVRAPLLRQRPPPPRHTLPPPPLAA